MTTKCPQCGAPLASGETCRDRFDATQLKELEHPASYYTVHHLSIPCYMLQHNLYSRKGWLATRQLLQRFIHEDLTLAEARREMQSMLDGGQRAWSLTWGAKLSQVDDVVWTRTIADVRLDTAEHYCADVRAWAIAEHVISGDCAYLGRIGWKLEKGQGMITVRQGTLDGLAASARGELPAQGPRGGRRWTPRYFVRRVAWHVLDHAWEIEDRIPDDR